MRFCLAAVLLSGAALADESKTASVSEVLVRGAVSPVPLETRVGEPYNIATISRDVRTLHATGHFADIRVDSEPAPEGTRLTFQLTPNPRLTLGNVEIIPNYFPLRARELTGERIDPARARAIAEEYKRQLVAAGHPDAEVRPQLAMVAPSVANLRLHITAGDRVRVKRVHIEGDTDNLGRSVLQAIKPRYLRSPAYSTAAIEADMARIRSAYIARGHVDAAVRLDRTQVREGRAEVIIAVRPGRKFAVQDDLCNCLHAERKLAEAAGVIDFSARATVDQSGVLTATPSPGRSYTIGRIDFAGHRKFSDAAIRRNLLLNEAEILNVRLLRKSLDRLNRSGMFEPLSEANVDVRTDEASGRADLEIHLRERKAGSWLLSGPVGPVSLAGPARFTLASRLPSWGRGLLDLSSYYLSVHLSPGQAVFALQRPFVPSQGWASGFVLAPQLGWKNMAAQYAGNQFRERALHRASLPEPAILVTIERADGETILVCDPPAPRWPWLKRSMSIALQFGSMLAL